MRAGLALPALNATVLVGLAATAFLAFGPANVGGPVTYMVISGNSMEPDLHRGDLVFVRSVRSVEVGDAVAYRSTRTGQHVLHRVIGTAADRFIVKGDNNSWVDSSQPTMDDVIGRYWLRVPAVGSFLSWLRTPLHAAVLAGGMVAMATYQGMKPEGRKLPRELGGREEIGLWPGMLQRAAGTTGQTLLGVLLGVAVLATTLATVAWRLPATRDVAAPLPTRHRGAFDYSAVTVLPDRSAAPLPGATQGPAGVAPDLLSMAQDPTLAALLLAPVNTGEPFFANVHPRVRFAFRYGVEAPAGAEISGTVRMDVELSDITGWKRTFPFSPEQPFTGNAVAIERSDIDIALLMVAFPVYQAITGHAPRYYLATLTATVHSKVVVDGVEVLETFKPSLEFRVVPPNEIYVETESTKQFESTGVIAQRDPSDHFTFSQGGAIPRRRTEAATVPVLGRDVGVRALRVASAASLALAAFGIAGVVMMQRLARQRGEVFMINARWARHLVNVEGDDPTHTAGSRVQVASVEDLLRLGHYHGVPVLVRAEPGQNCYFVRYGDQVYTHSVPLP